MLVVVTDDTSLAGKWGLHDGVANVGEKSGTSGMTHNRLSKMSQVNLPITVQCQEALDCGGPQSDAVPSLLATAFILGTPRSVKDPWGDTRNRCVRQEFVAHLIDPVVCGVRTRHMDIFFLW